MDEENSIRLKEWNNLTNRIEETGVFIGVNSVSRSLTMENFSRLFDEFLNLGGKGYREGQLIGQNLRSTHRSLQRLAICFAFGIIVGLSDQKFTDPRNEVAIETARKIRQMIDDGDLPFGCYL